MKRFCTTVSRFALAAIAIGALASCSSSSDSTTPALYSVTVGVTGLTGTGLVLQDNGASNLAITGNGSATFATGLATNTMYLVTVLTQPTGQTCAVSAAGGTVATANITGVIVACTSLTEFLYGANSADGVSAYSINTSTGALTALNGSPFAAEATGSSLGWITADPVTNVLFFALAQSNIQAWSASATTGALTAVAGAPFPGVDPVGPLVVSPSGNFAYGPNLTHVAGTTVFPNSISIYTVSGSGVLAAAASSPFKVDSLGAVPSSLVFTPSGQFLYSANAGVPGNPGNITGYSVNGSTGALTAITGSPFASTDSIAIVFSQLAVSPNGLFLYVSGGNGIAAYTINATSGALTPVIGSPFASAAFASGITIDPGTRFLYVGNSVSNGVGTGDISAYTINPVTGALTPVTGSPFNVGTYALSVVVDLAGEFLYSGNIGTTTNSQSASIGAFSINQSTGALTPVSGSPFFVTTTGGPAYYLTILK